MKLALSFIVVAALVACSSAWYLPGIPPKDYDAGQKVKLWVNKVDSVKTQVPYEYYKLPVCKPKKVEDENENLGEVLLGDKIESSAYVLRMKQVSVCNVLCHYMYTKKELAELARFVEEEYRVSWIVDNLPAATKYYTENADGGFQMHYEKGFALGVVGNEQTPRTEPHVKYINNHVHITVSYHEHTNRQNEVKYRVVGFVVEAFSVRHKLDGEFDENDLAKTASRLTTCTAVNRVSSQSEPQPVSHIKDTEFNKNGQYEIIYTYDVNWQSSAVAWASRWDVYLLMTDTQIHWFSIVNSIMIVLFLSGMIAMIMMRTLHRDLIRYNQLEEDDGPEETGWKNICGDVFRPPAHGGFFSVLVGSGVQVFAMSILTLTFALLGFLSPANRGGLMTALLLLFVFMAVFAGYSATRLYKSFGLTEWNRNTFWTAIFFPGTVFAIFFALNLLLWAKASSGAVPFGTLVALLILWFGISVPLVYVGSYIAFKKKEEKPPVKVNIIPRMIPDQAWYMQPQFSILVGGVLPFGAVFIEIFFIMSSVWLHQFYYMFGFLFIVFMILMITCAEITIVMCYFQLCGEDYNWWWRSFLTPGSSALYLFLYSVLYFFTKLEITSFVSGILFFGYMSLVSLAFFLLTGTIGYYSCHAFVHKIYSSIKID